jgi:hypothetical protein
VQIRFQIHIFGLLSQICHTRRAVDSTSVRLMSLFQLSALALLYFVSAGALLVLFGSVLAILLWMLLKLRSVAIRLLGGTIKE